MRAGAITEHHVQRRVRGYCDYVHSDQLRRRILALNGADKMDNEIATILNREGFITARGGPFTGRNIWLLRTRWGIPTVKINGVSKTPTRWPDGSFSIQGAVAELGMQMRRTKRSMKEAS
jgi:hypothetical protein